MQFRVPHFTVVDGKLDFKGLIRPEDATLEDNSETDRLEVLITIALLASMRDRCESNGVKFYFLNLVGDDRAENKDVLRSIQSSGIPLIDLSSVPFTTFPTDQHPNATWHAAVADRIASDPRVAFLQH